MCKGGEPGEEATYSPVLEFHLGNVIDLNQLHMQDKSTYIHINKNVYHEKCSMFSASTKIGNEITRIRNEIILGTEMRLLRSGMRLL